MKQVRTQTTATAKVATKAGRNTKAKASIRTKTPRIGKPKRETRFSAKAREMLAEEVLARIEAFNPLRSRPQKRSAKTWAKHQDAIRDLATRAAEKEPGISIAVALSALTGFASYVENESLTGELETLLTTAHIDTYCSRFNRAAASRRHALRQIAQSAGISLQPSAILVAKQPLKEPYSENEIEAYIEYATNLTNQHRRGRLLSTLLLGAGFGLVRGAQTGVCHSALHRHNIKQEDGTATEGQYHLRARDCCLPLHPLLASTAELLLAEQNTDGETFFVPPRTNKNQYNKPAAWIPAHLPKLQPDRLRSFYATWILSAGYPLRAAMQILHIETVSGLSGYLPHLPTLEACDE
jgi:hypothetical protein